MAEVQVQFIARKNLTGTHEVGDTVEYLFEMETFDPSIYDSVRSSEMIDGTTYNVELFANERYSCSTINYSGDDLLGLKEFLYSVRGGYPFDMTNPDNGDIGVTPDYMEGVKMIGNFKLNREARFLDDYSATFVVQDFTAI